MNQSRKRIKRRKKIKNSASKNTQSGWALVMMRNQTNSEPIKISKGKEVKMLRPKIKRENGLHKIDLKA